MSKKYKLVPVAWATRLYNTAYHAGHHDTVEGCYTHVYPQDMGSYHEDIVQEWLADNPQPVEQQPASHDWDDQDKCRRCGNRDWYASATCTPKWRPIEAAPDREYILILVDGQITGVGSTYLGDWWASMPNGEVCELNEPPTHWMPLPTPPETE